MPVQSKPVPILNISKEKVSINTVALQSILEKVGNHHFAFYSINGPKRTGKSFMLSNFIRFLNIDPKDRQDATTWLINSVNQKVEAFEWRGGSERNTTGIDVWSEPFWVERNGRKVAILLMDTQGSFDDQTTLQQNAVIFAISTLLSSVLVFNIMRDITEDLLQFFQFFSSYATLTVPDDASVSDGGAFQNLVFLLRDFQFIRDYKLGYYDDRTKPNGQGKNFKKEKIDPNRDQPEEVRFIHDQVAKSFQNIGVYLMPEPGKGLKIHDEVNNLDEEFVEHLELFVKLILSTDVVTKKIGGIEVTGLDMIKYVNSWAALFEGHGIDGMPEIKSIYHSAADQQYIMAKQMSLTYLASEMQQYLKKYPDGVQESVLENKQADLVIAASNIYKGRRNLGGKEYDRKFEQEFPEEADRLLDTFKSINHANLKAGQIKKEMEEKNRIIREEIQQTEAQMQSMKNDHEEQQQQMKNDIEQGRSKASDLELLLKEQEKVQDDIKTALEKKNQQIQRLEDEARNASNNGLDFFGDIGKVLGGIVSSILPGFLGKLK